MLSIGTEIGDLYGLEQRNGPYFMLSRRNLYSFGANQSTSKLLKLDRC